MEPRLLMQEEPSRHQDGRRLVALPKSQVGPQLAVRVDKQGVVQPEARCLPAKAEVRACSATKL